MSWSQGLQFKLMLLLGLITVLLAAGAYVAGSFFVRSELMDDSFRYEREGAIRVADRFNDLSAQVQQLTTTIAAVTLQAGSAAKTQLPALVPALADRNVAGGLVVAVGVWPMPKTLDPAAERASLFWLRDASGAFKQLADYNDGRAVPYTRESWFTPAAYAPANRCYWTPAYREALSQQEVVSCTLPLRDSRGFIGAVTVSLSVIRLNEMFARVNANTAGYSLLIGRDNRLLGISDTAARSLGPKLPINLVQLSQQKPAFNPLSLTFHQRDEAFISAAVQSTLYDAATVSALKDGTRDLSRQEAESALATIWNSMSRADSRNEAPPRQLRLETDAIFDAPAYATVLELPQTFWQLVRVTPVREGFSGVQYFFNQTLVVMLAASLLLVSLIYVGINWLIIRPLRRMTHELEQAESTEDALHLQFDERARNEIGVLSHWHNERVRQLREMMERTIATSSQLVVESDERRTAQEALAKAQERATLALQSVADGVIMTNERGIVEDINTVAENVVGVGMRSARGRPFSDVFKVRTTDASLSAHGQVPNLAELAIQRGTRLEHLNGVFLQRETQGEVELYVSATPIRTKLNRVIGAIIVFRPSATVAESGGGGSDRRLTDPVTGLPNRLACNRALRTALDTMRNNPRPQVLLFLDVDHLKRINETSGPAAGDEVLARLAEALLARVGNAGDVFRVGADQFVVLLSSFDVERARVFAEALRELLANSRIYWESKTLNVTVSIGVAPFSEDLQDSIELMRRVEEACMAAKRSGRNAVRVFDAGIDRTDRAVDDSVWVRRIRTGLEKGLFHLTTQWIMPVQSHQTEGHVFEILMALEDEEGFWASPSAFMPVAERHHLLPEMDRWVIRATLEHLARHPETVDRLSFCSINLSAGTLSDNSLVEFLADQFHRCPEVPPSKLCFELREDALAEFPGQAQIFCDAMRSLGVRVGVDHFVGRSTTDIGLIRRLNVDLIKIDALQYRSLSSDPVEQMLAESTIRLGRTLRKRVITSNIADAGTLDAWRRLGADYLQGFSVAKPSPVVFYAPGG